MHKNRNHQKYCSYKHVLLPSTARICASSSPFVRKLDGCCGCAASYSSLNRRWVNISAIRICPCSLSAICELEVRFMAGNIANVLRVGRCVSGTCVVLAPLSDMAHGLVFYCYKQTRHIRNILWYNVRARILFGVTFFDERYTGFWKNVKLTETSRPSTKDSCSAASCGCRRAVRSILFASGGVPVTDDEYISLTCHAN